MNFINNPDTGPAVFDIHGESGALNALGMTMESCQVLEGNVVWLRYRFSWGTLPLMLALGRGMHGQ